MGLPEVNTGRLILRRGENSHFNTRLMMVIFLPSFVLPGVHLIWFSTGLFPLQPLASNAHSAIFGKYTHFCFLSVSDEEL